MAGAFVNQAYVNAHHDDSLEMRASDYLAARQDTVDLLQQFTDEQLAAPVPTVVGEQAAGDLFAGRAGHAATHLTWIEEGFRRGAGRLVSFFAGLQRLDQVYIRRGIMKYLLTSSGISNDSIHDALVDLLGKPIAESSALCIPTAAYA